MVRGAQREAARVVCRLRRGPSQCGGERVLCRGDGGRAEGGPLGARLRGAGRRREGRRPHRLLVPPGQRDRDVLPQLGWPLRQRTRARLRRGRVVSERQAPRGTPSTLPATAGRWPWGEQHLRGRAARRGVVDARLCRWPARGVRAGADSLLAGAGARAARRHVPWLARRRHPVRAKCPGLDRGACFAGRDGGGDGRRRLPERLRGERRPRVGAVRPADQREHRARLARAPLVAARRCRLYLPYISPISPLYLRHVSP